MKKLISLLLCLLLLTACSSQTPDSPSAEEKAPRTITVKVIGLDEEVILAESVEYRDGITAFDILIETAKAKNIPVVYSGGTSSPYITSISGLAEKQHGSSSGWIFTVNGESVMKPCNKYMLNPDDTVEWKYLTEFTFE